MNFSLRRKPKETQASQATGGRHTSQMQRLFEVLPVPPDTAMQTFMGDYTAALQHIGERADTLHVADHGPMVSRVFHSDLALSLCVEAARIVMTKRGRRNAWSNHYDGDADLIWMRTAWRCALALPLGYVIAHHRVVASRTQYHWCPAASGLDDFLDGSDASVFESHRPHSGAAEAHGVYHLLFCPQGHSHPHFALMAVSNALSDRPDRDNPIYAAIRGATRCVSKSAENPSYPFWWQSFLSDHQYLGPNPTPSAVQTLPLPTPSQVSVPVVASGKRHPTEAGHSRPPSDAKSATITQFADEFIDRLAALLRDGTVALNTGGAIFHKVDGDLHIIHPTGWDRCAKLTRLRISGDQLGEVMRRARHTAVDDGNRADVSAWYICPEGRSPENNVGVMRLQRLSSTVAARLLPFTSLSDNPDLVRKDPAT